MQIETWGERILPYPLNPSVEIRKEWKAHPGWWLMGGEEPAIQNTMSGFLPDAPPLQQQSVWGAPHNVNQLSVHWAGGLKWFGLNQTDILFYIYIYIYILQPTPALPKENSYRFTKERERSFSLFLDVQH